MPQCENCQRNTERLIRVEQKLDALIQALADECDDETEPKHDLEGNLIPPERDETEPL